MADVDPHLVRDLIARGEGVEDIAVALEWPVEEIRKVVSQMRAEGVIEQIFKKEASDA
ncbi:hypothetical protein [Oceanicola sp. S124]|uniref:hypothetical protein n=1 Tax=Oceanicola sp. S124 TaxID=1042378 RepID=UPI00143C553C|nr:hypothetical protein [Oceanicola sp. S124]